MRTLVLTQVVPYPGDAGPKIKTHYALRTLAQEHDVELLTFARSEAEHAAAEEMRRWCSAVGVVPLHRRRALEPYHALRGWSRRMPFLVQRDFRRAFLRAVEARLARGDIDVLHADQLTMAQYLSAARGTTATVFDAHNAVWKLVRELAPSQPSPPRRAASAIEWRMLRRFEGWAARSSTLTLAVSASDRAALAAAAGCPIASAVVPIGIEARERAPVEVPIGSTRLLSVATMHYPPNADALRWFRDAIWPIVTRENSDARVDVVGPRPPDDLVGWGRADARVSVPGHVSPEELDRLYRDAAVLIVPLRSGSGVRVKILEAMAMGVPVVSTSIGAHGLEVVPGEHLLIADDPAEFAAATLSLLASPARRAALAAAARQLALARYDWRVCCRPLLDAYRTLPAGAAARAGTASPAAHPHHVR